MPTLKQILSLFSPKTKIFVFDNWHEKIEDYSKEEYQDLIVTSISHTATAIKIFTTKG